MSNLFSDDHLADLVGNASQITSKRVESDSSNAMSKAPQSMPDLWAEDVATTKIPEGDSFSESDWEEGGIASDLLERIWSNLRNKLDDMSALEEIRFTLEFTGNYAYDLMSIYKDTDDAKSRRACDLLKDIIQIVQNEVTGWKFTNDELLLYGEFAKISEAMDTRFKGTDFETGMYLLNLRLCERLGIMCSQEIETYERKKGLFNREEMNVSIAALDETRERFKKIDFLYNEVFGNNDNTDDYFA